MLDTDYDYFKTHDIMLRYFKYKLDSGIQNLVLKTLLTAKAQREKISRVLSGGNRRSVVSHKVTSVPRGLCHD